METGSAPAATPRYLESTEQTIQLLEDLQQTIDAHNALIQAVKDKDIAGIRANLNESGMLSRKGWSALGLAAKLGYEEGVRELAPHEKQIHMDIKLKLGSMVVTRPTALILAACYNLGPIIKILLDFEAGAMDGEGRVALIHASAKGNLDAVRLLAPKEGELYAEDALEVCCSQAQSCPDKKAIEKLLKTYIA